MKLDSTSVARRRLLQATLLGPLVAAAGARAEPVQTPGGQPSAEPRDAQAALPVAMPAYVFLKPAEALFVEALADHMVPADALPPSGVELGITTFIDRALSSGWGRGEGLYLGGPWHSGTPEQGYQLPLTPAQLFRAGLQAIEALPAAASPSFAQATPGERDAFLLALERGALGLDGVDEKALFALLYQLVVEGLFADPIYGGNRDKAGWAIVGFPGVIASHAEDVVTFKNKPYAYRSFGIADAS